jgi:hypothetical protein
LWANYPIPDDCELIPVTIERSDGVSDIAKTLVKKTEELTGKKFNHLILPTPPRTATNPVAYPIRIAYEQNKFDFIISGDTLIPEEVPSANGFHPSPRRTPESNTDSRKWHVPLMHLDKRFTVKLVHDLGLDWISRESNSCTPNRNLRCKICWWCRERAWAYESLSLEDFGTK